MIGESLKIQLPNRGSVDAVSATAGRPTDRVLGGVRAPGRSRPNWRLRVAMFLIVLLGCVAFAKAQRSSPLSVRTHAVERGRVRNLVSSVAAGRISATREATLRAEFSGSVRELLHGRGDSVQEGEALLTYEGQELIERRRAAESGVALARAQAAEARARSALSRLTSERTERLHGTGALATAELDQARGKAKEAASAAEAGRAALEQAIANLGLATTALAKSVVKAPFSGIVLETSVCQGDVVLPGLQLMRLADTSGWYVEAEIDEADLGRVEIGMQAEVALDAFENQRMGGTLLEIAPSVNRDSRGSRSIAVRVGLNPDARLRVGLSADIDIVVSTHEDVLWVPANAVLGRGADRSVYVVENGYARKRSITTGISNWERIEVLSGVTAGEPVIDPLSLPQIAEGTAVRPDNNAMVRRPLETHP